MKGFFTEASLEDAAQPVESTIPKCGVCKLYDRPGCNSPKMPVSGGGRRKILIIGEAPGADEDDQGEPFVGKSGLRLRRTLREHGLDSEDDCWYYNSIICRPPDNRTPTVKELLYCSPNVERTIRELKPRVIIPLGASAVKSLLRTRWQASVDSITRWAGCVIPRKEERFWICPSWHPSYLLRQNNRVLDLLFSQHIKAAIEIERRPNKPIDYKEQIEIIHEPSEAAKVIKQITKSSKFATFDYETKTLKPDGRHAKIVTASICDNAKRTIAFPYIGDAAKAFRSFLRSRVPKGGWNIKFEQRWTLRILKIRVRNWVLDGMQISHILNNTRGITSLDFQVFVRLGIKYSSKIKPYLKSKGTNSPNKIEQADLHELLLYNGLDSLLECIILKQQAKELGLDGVPKRRLRY